MRILIDIGHPAHVHLFKNFAWEMQKKGHEIFFTCRDKEFEIYLLDKYGFKYKSFGKKYQSMVGKLWGMIEFDIKEFLAGLKFKPDILLSHGSIYAAHAAFLLRKPHIALEDTFNFEQIRLYKPFTEIILTGTYHHPLKSNKVISYAGYHELAYLHPDRFHLTENDVNVYEKYIFVRFVSWSASHDYGHLGISVKNKIKIIEKLSNYGKILISSECELPKELKEFHYHGPPEQIHSVLKDAALVFSESATMVSEGAVLGVPGIYLDNTGRLYTKEQEEKYGLVFNYTESEEDQNKALEKAIELLTVQNLKEEWQKRRQKMLSEKIDVTAFLIWFVEKYPESLRMIRGNPEYQLRFR